MFLTFLCICSILLTIMVLNLIIELDLWTSELKDMFGLPSLRFGAIILGIIFPITWCVGLVVLITKYKKGIV